MSEGNLFVDVLGREILEELRGKPGAGDIVIGGYTALSRLAHYRESRDLDAWWKAARSAAGLAALQSACESVAARRGLRVQHRSFGDVDSFEFDEDARKVYAVQIAVRSVELAPPEPSPWSPVMIEASLDTIGAKMNALVARGAPRDFLDIYELVHAGRGDPEECWRLWERKNPGASRKEAARAVLLHLETLETRRPVSALGGTERDAVVKRREWFRTVLLVQLRRGQERGR